MFNLAVLYYKRNWIKLDDEEIYEEKNEISNVKQD